MLNNRGRVALQRARRAAALAVCLVILPVGGSIARGAETHAFDAELSLTGGCTTSQLDPIPDPGCPGGTHPPSGSFSAPHAIATDSYGDIYVASRGAAEGEGRIDIFDATGLYLFEISDPAGPQSLTVDSVGNLYVVNGGSGERIVRYSPSKYEPQNGVIEYQGSPTILLPNSFSIYIALDVDRSNDHLFAHLGTHINEYSSAAAGNELLDESVAEVYSPHGSGLAVDAAHHRLYASDTRKSPLPEASVIRIFDLNSASPHTLLQTIDGSGTPNGKFLADALSVAVDEGTGHFFVFDAMAAKVYEFDADGSYLATIEHGFNEASGVEIGVDNGANSPNGALGSGAHYLFVPAGLFGVGHSYAFGPSNTCPPEVEAISFADVNESEAQLRATVNPCELETGYRFEYTTEQSFQAQGFTGATVGGEGQIPAGGLGVPVSAGITGLAPGIAYRFRLVASNSEGSDEMAGVFVTSVAIDLGSDCANAAVREGLSALLPDCRAFELVTPPDTNARTPRGLDHLGTYFATREASPAGDKLSFEVEGGVLPGEEGTGAYAGDPYTSTRGEYGWSTTSAGPTGSESMALLPGSTSPDQGYSFWGTGGPSGSAALEGEPTSYVRYPDGHSELVGRGSIGEDREAEGKLISENGSHIIFVSPDSALHPAVRLEPNAPPDGNQAIYDRTSDEITHVVSLLPGGKSPTAGEDALYVGASLDGRGVAFSLGSMLYLRVANEETYAIGEGVTFAGIAEGGGRIFYLKGGNLKAFDASSGETISFSASGNVTVVNVAADGHAAYLVSPSVLAKETNPNGAKAKSGEENLYLSREGQISFVGTLTPRDVEGEWGGVEMIEGLGLWTMAAGSSDGNAGGFAADPSRTTPDGNVLLFESRASLTGYDSEEHRQVYRYDQVNERLHCLSCNPTGAPAVGDGSLESLAQGSGDRQRLSTYDVVANLSSDGQRAFFQSTEPLVPTDRDGLQDVYEWEEQGVGSCTRIQGCIYLISSGHSTRLDLLYAVSESGNDVFFRSSDLLLPIDRDETPSIYDARVGGGFPEGFEIPCEGEGCRPTLSQPPALSQPGMLASKKSGNISHRCPKGKRKARKRGRVRCVRRHRKHRHSKKAASHGKGPR
jgi:hypothetical protein